LLHFQALSCPLTNFIILPDKTRGFGFVEYDLEEDAAAALDNMDGAELYGRVLRCNIAKAMPKLPPGKAIWSAEEWIQNSLNDDNAPAEDEAVEAANLNPNQ